MPNERNRHGSLIALDSPLDNEENTRQERREVRVANQRKMRVTGRSVFTLERLSREQNRSRRQQRRRKTGAQ